ncbi:MAG: hypothetical protein JWP64_5716, partial [Pseudonocardia sp.]|nr:hypothetical protein [Pseudonocardia sp.]
MRFRDSSTTRRRAVTTVAGGLVLGALLSGVGVATGTAPDVVRSARAEPAAAPA